MAHKFCINPNCNKAELQESQFESTLTMKKFYCTKCGRTYGVPTPAGSVIQAAPIVTAAVLLSRFMLDLGGSLLTGDAGVDSPS